MEIISALVVFLMAYNGLVQVESKRNNNFEESLLKTLSYMSLPQAVVGVSELLTYSFYGNSFFKFLDRSIL